MASNIGLFVFEKGSDISVFGDELGFEVGQKGYLKTKGETIKCKCCNKAIREKNLGSVLPGSRVFYCDELSCLADYVRDYLEK